MDFKKLSKKVLIEMIESTQRENLKLLSRQVKICDIIKAYEEEDKSPVTYIRKIANVVRYDEYSE